MNRYAGVRELSIHIVALISLLAASTPTRADTITHKYQRINVDYASSLGRPERQQLYVWLQAVADALLTVYGEWPKDRFSISIRTASSRHSPVPWGQVTRGNPDNVLLVVNPEADLREIMSDWTAFHELSHLLIPYRGHGDMWFSEGLATYYQSIIQARAGLLSEAGLWAKLAAGFDRGRNQNQWPQVDLAEISDHMRKYRNFMRVHWSGVHYWLTADIRLRQQSDNKTTLDGVLKQLKNCCQQRSMSAAAIAERLDLIAGVNIFKPLFIEYRASRAMPDHRPILTGLGVIAGQHVRAEYDVALTAEAPDAEIRKSIYQGDG